MKTLIVKQSMSLPLNDTMGYSSPHYFAALGESGVPLGQTGGSLITRSISGSNQTDLAGIWPLFTCQNWAGLAADIDALKTDHVTVTLVSDPFAPLSQADLGAIFPICRPLHDHWVIDLLAPPSLSKHHRRELRKVLPPQIVAGPPPSDLAIGWAQLYAHLVSKKNIQDSRAFSAQALAAQLAVPGAQVVTAWQGSTLLGVDLYYLNRGVAYAHLSAYSPSGYEASVSYPMMAAAMDYFATMAQFIDLGGAPAGSAGPGIARFKAGWTSQTRKTFLCGKVLNPEAYRQLAPAADPDGWFPAYRAGEFKT